MLRLYQEYLTKLTNEFKEIEFTHLGRDKKNKFNNALTILASMVMINYKVTLQPICIKVKSSQTHYFSVDTEIDGEP
jgi:hypothetical protein